MKKVAVASIALFALLVAWVLLFLNFLAKELVLFPGGTYQVYAVSDAMVGGFSNVELSKSDSVILAHVNIRSGMSYPYAGMGINLLSVNNRPASGFFDFSDFDSLMIDVETGRMQRIGVKILNDDPVYSQKNEYETYRPMVAQAVVGKKGIAVSMLDFKVPEWWLARQGLEKDDGLRYMNRGMYFEITNGEGTMLGIPDDIVVRTIKMWGENRTFKSLMYVALAVIFSVYAGVIALALRNSKKNVVARRKKADSIKSKMEKAKELLEQSDRSLAEITAVLELKNVGQLERDFVRVYGMKPLDFRKRRNGK